MIATGENVGSLDFALQSVSDYYNKIIPRRIKIVFAIFDPVMMISLIAIVGCRGPFGHSPDSATLGREMKFLTARSIRRLVGAFTLIELIGVMAIMAIMASVLVPNVLKSVEACRGHCRSPDLHNLGIQIRNLLESNRSTARDRRFFRRCPMERPTGALYGLERC